MTPLVVSRSECLPICTSVCVFGCLSVCLNVCPNVRLYAGFLAAEWFGAFISHLIVITLIRFERRCLTPAAWSDWQSDKDWTVMGNWEVQNFSAPRSRPPLLPRYHRCSLVIWPRAGRPLELLWKMVMLVVDCRSLTAIQPNIRTANIRTYMQTERRSDIQTYIYIYYIYIYIYIQAARPTDIQTHR